MAALPSMAILLYAAVLASVLVLLFKIAYSYFWHPFRHVPGPFIAKLTSKWLSYRDIAGTRTASLHELHQVYGPVVRVAPDELSFADPLAIKDIYGQGTPYMKSPFYDGMHLGTPNLFDQG
ncbi:MAG: cytochrome P450 [Lasallia pustulata]|uniref:Cytochrome P450 n=1 Tax=Lasallia pustulata TaxID=136370 RepID=A0A5M8PQ92_9LECA|nr:MAG: cytochrome P450 [Lasallia pustulata]